MEIKNFNEYMNKLKLSNELPRDIQLLILIESLLEEIAGKWGKRNEWCFIAPPWFYDVKESSIGLYLEGKYFDIPVGNSDLLLALKEQKPYKND